MQANSQFLPTPQRPRTAEGAPTTAARYGGTSPYAGAQNDFPRWETPAKTFHARQLQPLANGVAGSGPYQDRCFSFERVHEMPQPGRADAHTPQQQMQPFQEPSKPQVSTRFTVQPTASPKYSFSREPPSKPDKGPTGTAREELDDEDAEAEKWLKLNPAGRAALEEQERRANWPGALGGLADAIDDGIKGPGKARIVKSEKERLLKDAQNDKDKDAWLYLKERKRIEEEMDKARMHAVQMANFPSGLATSTGQGMEFNRDMVQGPPQPVGGLPGVRYSFKKAQGTLPMQL